MIIKKYKQSNISIKKYWSNNRFMDERMFDKNQSNIFVQILKDIEVIIMKFMDKCMF